MKHILTIFSIGTLIAMCKSCATVGSPTGGVKDTIAPSVKYMSPLNKSTNFKGKQIVIEYDEYLELNAIDKELVIIPKVEDYQIEKGTKDLKIKFKTPLEANTTYQIFFNKGVKDNTEGNLARLQSFAFSTGPYVDSLSISGKVINVHTNKLSKAFVGLYIPSDTLNIAKHIPYYWTVTTDGTFKFDNLKEGNFEIYAFTDNNSNRLYEKKELIAYRSARVNTKDRDSIHLKLSPQNLDTLKHVSTTENKEYYVVKYSKNLYAVKVPETQVYKIDKEKLLIYKGREDSISFNVTVKDSLQQELTTHVRSLNKSKPIKNNKFIKDISGQAIPGSKYVYLTDRKIDKINHDSLVIIYDGKRLAKEEIITSKDSVYFKVPKYEDSLSIAIKKSAFVSLFNDSLTSSYTLHKKFDESNYGILAGQVVYDGPIVLEFIRNDKVAYATSSKNFEIKNLSPGEYTLRVIKDVDQNGYWTQGNYKIKKQPEEIFYNPKTVVLKANWELRDLLIKVE